MTISDKIVQNEKIRTIINSDYEDKQFISLMKGITKESIECNSFYKEFAIKEKFKMDDVNQMDDLALIPFLGSATFKQSTGMFKKLLKIPIESPEFKTWNVSSCTTGDPSLVGRSLDDLEFLASMTIKCIYEFIPIPMEEHNQYGTISMNFAPNVTFLNRIAMRYSDLRPLQLYTSTLNDITTKITKPKYLIKFFIFKAFKEIIKRHSLVGAFGINSKHVVKTIKKNSIKPVEKQKNISIGGSLQLINTFINKNLKETKIKFDLPNCYITTGGGGWNGHKSQLKYPPIEKTQFVSDCIEFFGTKVENITDIYGFTETPIVFGSHWSEKHQDFIFHCPPQARIIIRDLNTLDPLRNIGDQGFLEVLTPFGVNASINHAILVDDLVELISKNKCHECGYESDTFTVQGRIKDKEGLGCSSLVEWI
ncbi:MAG: hypothetical protein ACFFDH_00680 [Promethearchaeota archaeon]